MNEKTLQYWLALLHAPGVGATRFARIISHLSPETLFTAPIADVEPQLRAAFEAESNAKAVNALKTYLQEPDWQSVEKDLAWQQDSGGFILTLADEHYPSLLKEIDNPPPVLFVLGDVHLLSSVQLAIVGSRNPTPGGSKSAFDFAAHLAANGMCITSGLALGVDGEAHRGALSVGGKTIAVTGTGLDRVYPAKHRDLAHQIAQTGALISEFAPGSNSKAAHFPQRNRVISGLSVGTLVVEAAIKSGSLITARQATEQGREVFAIPGSIHNPLARGCHALIKQGGKLVEQADDILSELGSLALASQMPTETGRQLSKEDSSPTTPYIPAHLPKNQQQLLSFVGFDPISIDTLVTKSQFSVDEVTSLLLLLELSGHVQSLPGGHYTRLA